MQRQVVDHLLDGQSALVIMPTGGGKSLCYQVPALARPGLGVVISPLIALMQDQVQALQQSGVRALAWHGQQSASDKIQLRQAVESGQLDLLYLSPERLQLPGFSQWLAAQPLSLIAVDEAHCISQWGHDFRQDYLQLSQLLPLFQGVPILALTATADQRTQQEICQRLQLSHCFNAGFDRENIFFRVEAKRDAKRQLYRYLKTDFKQQAGIIYCRTRKAVETLAEDLQKQGFNALAYHAGLDAELRWQRQQAFKQSEELIMVATIAFGMGIDKRDVRFIVHMDLPLSIEAYFQETGRAGRDGLPAQALLFYGTNDVVRGLRLLAQSEQPERLADQQQRFLAMLQVCEATGCRRQLLLAHFGQASEPCGYCDNCQDPPEVMEVQVAAQKALSAVFHTGQRYGMGYLIDLLLGQSVQIKQAAHQQLSLFGLGTELSEVQWRWLYRWLLAHGCLSLNEHGGLMLQEAARPILQGKQQVRLNLLQQHQGLKQKSWLASEHQPLFEDLRLLRRELAAERSIPPYMVFSDASLQQMAANQPQSQEQFAKISGVGQSKLIEYGPLFTARIRQFLLQQVE